MTCGGLTCRRVKEVLDFIACLIAPYLYLKNVRRDLQLGKTILHEVAPDQVKFCPAQLILNPAVGGSVVFGSVSYPAGACVLRSAVISSQLRFRVCEDVLVNAAVL